MSSGPFLSHKRAFMNNLAVACAALSAEKRHKMSLTSNCVFLLMLCQARAWPSLSRL